ncbi:hypothetical protein Fcan01_00411 [Folsomia candida]|uniref:Uncharacterized protein n=1 Tax=Folsomia candida TaxID=158441 RepID=A0A226EX49_FOLCA|nr:hypothetical protein Fcan01_00411 [Folsomia candida]
MDRKVINRKGFRKLWEVAKRALFSNICFGWLTLTERFQGFVFFSLYFFCCMQRWNWNLDIAGIQVINSFLDYEDELLADNPPPPLSLGAKMMRIFIPTAEISLPVIALLQFLLLRYAPCTPPFIMSMQPKCTERARFSVVQLGVHVFEGWMFLHMLLAGGCWVIYALFTGIVSILSYFSILNRKIEAIETEANLNTSIQFYQRIQILEKSYNSFLRDRILPSMILCVPGIQIITQYVTLNHHSDIAMPGFLVFPLIAVNTGMTNVLAFTLAAFVNSASEKVMETLGKKASLLPGKKSLIKRRIRGCSVLKVKFGSNFIDRGTPLVMQTFCINQTVSLTLIKQGKSVHLGVLDKYVYADWLEKIVN